MAEKIVGLGGPMFSGKTRELLLIAEREKLAGRNVQVFKPAIDDRGEGNDKIVSRFSAKKECEAIPISEPVNLFSKLKEDTEVVIIDEAQFFDQKNGKGVYEIVRVVREVSRSGVIVYFAGLVRDFRREPFGPMPDLMANAQEILLLCAVCNKMLDNGKICGAPASETQRYIGGKPASYDDPIVIVGDAKEGYAARCLKHHEILNTPTF
jgi:thymidine kinase